MGYYGVRAERFGRRIAFATLVGSVHGYGSGAEMLPHCGCL
jgi:hypothetical protein